MADTAPEGWRGPFTDSEPTIRMSISKNKLRAESVFDDFFTGKFEREMSESKGEYTEVVYSTPPDRLNHILEMEWPEGWWNDKHRHPTREVSEA